VSVSLDSEWSITCGVARALEAVRLSPRAGRRGGKGGIRAGPLRSVRTVVLKSRFAVCTACRYLGRKMGQAEKRDIDRGLSNCS